MRKFILVMALMAGMMMLALPSHALATYNLLSDWTAATVPPTDLGPDGVWSYGTVNWDRTSQSANNTFTAYPNYGMGPAWAPWLCYNLGPDPATGPPLATPNGTAPGGSLATVWTHSPGEGTASCFRWTNSTGRAMVVKVTGTTQVPWTSPTRPVTFVLRKNGTGAFLYQRHIVDPDSAEVAIPGTVVQVAINDTIDLICGMDAGSSDGNGQFQVVSMVVEELPSWDLLADWQEVVPPVDINGAWAYGSTSWVPAVTDSSGNIAYNASTFVPFPYFSAGPEWWAINLYNNNSAAPGPPCLANVGTSIRTHSSGSPTTTCRWKAPALINVQIFGYTFPTTGTSAARPIEYQIRHNSDVPPLYVRKITSDPATWGNIPLPGIPVINCASGDTIDVAMAGSFGAETGTWQDVNLIVVDVGVPTMPMPVISPAVKSSVKPVTVTISEIQSGATINYTTDGSTPTAASPEYGGSFTLSTSAVVKAYAHKVGFYDSGMASATITILTPPVTWYSIGDYVGGVVPATGIGPEEVWSYGMVTGYNENTFAIGAFSAYDKYAIDPWWVAFMCYQFTSYGPPPLTWIQMAERNWWTVHTPAGGYASVLRWTAKRAITVDLTGDVRQDENATRGQQFAVEKNGSVLFSSTLDKGPSPAIVAISGCTNIHVEPGDNLDLVMGVAPGPYGDGVGTFVRNDITIAEQPDTWRLPMPTFSPAPGSYATAQSVTLSDAEPGAAIYYTTDGSTPTSGSPLYSVTPIPVPASMTIKALAIKGGWLDSDVASGVFSIEAPVPTFNPPSGTFNGSVRVAISDAAAGATIRYTLDNSTPTESSALYSTPITLTATTTVKAKAWAAGADPSSVGTAVYTYSGNAMGAWDLALDWVDAKAVPINIGTDWAWSYGIGGGGSGPMEFATFTPYAWGGGIGWGPGGAYQPAAGPVPAWQKKQDGGWGGMDWPTGTIGGHAGGTSVFRWTSPASTTVNLSSYCYVAFFADNPPGKGGGDITRSEQFGVRHSIFTGSGLIPDPSGFIVDPVVCDWAETYVEGVGQNDPYNYGVTLLNYVRTATNVNVEPGDTIDFVQWPVATPGGTGIGMTITEVGPRRTPAPQITPGTGTFLNTVTVTITDLVEGAVIHYRTDGVAATPSDPVYPGPIVISTVGSYGIRAMAVAAGLGNSAVAAADLVVVDYWTWDLADEWVQSLIPPVGIGIDGVWSYGYDSTPGGDPASYTFTTYPYGNGGLFGWLGAPDASYLLDPTTVPQVVKKTNDGGWGGFDCPIGNTAGHTQSYGQPVIFRWTAPRAIMVDVSAKGWYGYKPGFDDPLQPRPQMFSVRKNSLNGGVLVPEAPQFVVGPLVSGGSSSSSPIIETATGISVETGDTIDYFAYPPQSTGSNTGSGGAMGFGFTVTEESGTARVAAPQMSPGGGIYLSAPSVSLSCATAGATICYTTDGSTPTGGSPAYGVPIATTSGMTIKAKGFKAGLTDSNMSAGTYVVTTVKTIAEVKSTTEGQPVAVQGVYVVLSPGGNKFYVEQADRAFGIQVRKNYAGYRTDTVLDITGNVRTDGATQERYIDASVITVVSLPPDPLPIPYVSPVPPVGLNGRAVGGGAYGLQAAVPGCTGLNNVGLYVTIWGKLTKVGLYEYTLNDGSKDIKVLTQGPLQYVKAADQGSPDPATIHDYPVGTVISITGVVSMDASGPVVLLRGFQGAEYHPVTHAFMSWHNILFNPDP